MTARRDRGWTLIELAAEYAELARKRVETAVRDGLPLRRQ